MSEIRGFRREYYFLSNFFASPMDITYGGHVFTMSTGEHAFHAMKVAAMKEHSRDRAFSYLSAMQHAPTPGKSKYLGRSLEIDVERWNAMSYRCMERVTELKYTQNPNLAQRLIATEDALLVEENTWGDQLWGTVNGVGANQLGYILMNYRNYLTQSKEN